MTFTYVEKEGRQQGGQSEYTAVKVSLVVNLYDSLMPLIIRLGRLV